MLQQSIEADGQLGCCGTMPGNYQVELAENPFVVQQQMILPVSTVADLINWWQAASSSRTVTSAIRAMVPTILQV